MPSDVCSHFVSCLVIATLVPNDVHRATFLLFATACLAAHIWSTHLVPETAGASLEDMDAVFESKVGMEERKVKHQVCLLLSTAMTDITSGSIARSNDSARITDCRFSSPSLSKSLACMTLFETSLIARTRPATWLARSLGSSSDWLIALFVTARRLVCWSGSVFRKVIVIAAR